MGSFGFGYIQPVRPDPVGYAQEYQQLRALADQRALRQQQIAIQQQTQQENAIKLEQMQRGIAEDDAMRQMMPGLMQQYRTADNQPDWQQVYNAAAQSGKFGRATLEGFQKHIVDTAKTNAAIAKDRAEADRAAQEAIEKKRQVELQANDYFANQAQDMIDSGHIDNPAFVQAKLHQLESDFPNYKPQIDAFRQQIAADPTAARTLFQQKADMLSEAGRQARTEAATKATALAATRRTQAAGELSAIIDPQTGLPTDAAAYTEWTNQHPEYKFPAEPSGAKNMAFVRAAVPIEKQPEFDLNTYKARMGLVGNSEYDQFLAQYAKSLGKTPATLTPQEGMQSFQKFAEFKRDPVMRDVAIANARVMESMHQMQLGQMPTAEDAKMYADDIINHRLAPDQITTLRGRGNGNLGTMIYREIKKQQPDFNWEQATSEYALAKSPQFQQNIRYMDYVDSSIGNVIRAADSLNNQRIRSINSVLNWSKDQLNGVDIARFNTARLEVSDAIAKILQGGGSGSGTSDMKLKQAQELIRATDDPQVVRAVTGEIKDLIHNRRQTLTKGTYLEQAGGGGGTQQTGGGGTQQQQTSGGIKAGDSVMYQGRPHKVREVKPNGKLVLEP